MSWSSYLVFALFLLSAYFFYSKLKVKKQLSYIKKYHFHKSIRNKIKNKYPHIDEAQTHLVFRALRDYFWMCNKGKRNMVAMPSQVVDDGWHEFILFTRSYKKFCQKALGRFLHHTPTEAMRTPTLAQEGIKRAWRLACAKENINPGDPAKLPLIFAIDSMLNIPNGFKYSLNCKDENSAKSGDGYCAGHIGCSSGCVGDSAADTNSDGFFDGLFDSTGCGADCGGGCGGD